MQSLTSHLPRRSLIAPKFFYFCYYAAAAALMPFLPLYYDHQGISARHIGILMGLPPLIGLISAPFWGGVADATQRHRRVLLSAVTGSILAVFLLSRSSSLLWLLPSVVLYAFFVAPIMPLVDKSVLDLLGKHKDQYGKQRLWGAVGWGVAAPIVGWLVEGVDLIWAFHAYMIVMAAGLLAATRLTVGHVTIGRSFWTGLHSLLSDRHWTLFLLTVFVAGMGLAVINNFLFLYMEWLGANEGLMGLSLAVATVSELPVMFFADRLLQRWGAKGMLMISLAVYVVRMLAYSAISGPWPVLAINLLHGPTFSMMWMAGVAYADEHAPPGLGATAQGLFSGTVMGLGASLGALLGGLLYEGVGPVSTFRLAGFSVLVGLVVFRVTEKRLVRESTVL